MKPETRYVLERSPESERERLMLDQRDEVLQDFLANASAADLHEHYGLVPKVRAELERRMQNRGKDLFELLRETHILADKTYTINRKLYQKTVWILWLAGLAVLLALLALLK